VTGGESEENTQVPPSSGSPAESPATTPVRPSRRTFLLGGGLAVVAGAGAGVGVEYWRDRPAPVPQRHAPAPLRAALAAERDLLAVLDAALPGAGAAAPFLRQVRADHLAHERALAAAVTEAGGAPAGTSAPPTGTASTAPAAPVRSVAQLRQGETDASRAAARRARQLTGRNAALLASIAACEASHAELLA